MPSSEKPEISGNTDAYPEGSPFEVLLGWHMHWGTRPDGDPNNRGISWKRDELGSTVEGLQLPAANSGRKVGQWLSGTKPELYIAPLSKAIFGENPVHPVLQKWKKDFLDAFSAIPKKKRNILPQRLKSSAESDGICGGVTFKSGEYINNYPKMCIISLEVPSQAQSRYDFSIVGEISFSSYYSYAGDYRIAIGIRRAVVVLLPQNCRIAPGSMLGCDPKLPGITAGASQITISCGSTNGEYFLQGNKTNGNAIARFVIVNSEKYDYPSVVVHVEIENHNDLYIGIDDSEGSLSANQMVIAKLWYSEQVIKIGKTHDGCIRLCTQSVELV